jgi:hypothetical protein
MSAREALERLSDRVPVTANAEREYEIVDAAVAENETLRAALEPLAAQAQDILDVLASGSEPWAATGYGYEHMGDYTRDVKPLCEALVALASGDTDTQESK